MKIHIYQINRNRDTQQLKFMGLDAVRKVLHSAEPDSAAYDKVYSGDVKCRNLEDVFVLFQSGRPGGLPGTQPLGLGCCGGGGRRQHHTGLLLL